MLCGSMSAEGKLDEVVTRRFFADKTDGRMLEIGAARPDWLSLGRPFRQRGWDVLAVEPNPVFADLQRRAGNDVAELALSDRDADAAEFTIVDCKGARYREGAVSFESWSSLGIRGKFAEMQVPRDRKTITVKVRRADTLLRERRARWNSIDLIALDVEGWELEVLSGLDFDRYRPGVIIMENLFIERSYRRFMKRRGYVLWKRSTPNEVFVRADLLSRAEIYRAQAVAAVKTVIGRGRRKIARSVRRLLSVAHTAGKKSPVRVIRA